MKMTFQGFLVLFLTFHLFSNAEEPVKHWDSYWVTHPGICQTDYNVINFRKEFRLDKVPEKFEVHITADNRYRLFVNGNYAGYGPQQSDIRHYRYETIDIAPLLQEGQNLLAVEVINWGVDRGFGIISAKTGLLVQGKTEKESIINTNQEGWKCFHNQAYSTKPVNWMYAVDITGGFYASCHGDSLIAEKYPWGWETTEFDDSSWTKPEWTNGAVSKGGSFFWILEPRNTPLLKYETERIEGIIRISGAIASPDFVKGNAPVHIPANSKASILLDNKVLTLGYPELVFSGGKASSIQISYAESLYDNDRKKGNRNETEGKQMIGIKDLILPDGGSHRRFKPFYHKAFRFIQLDIETGDSELILEDYYNEKTTSPPAFIASFECNRDYSPVTEICERTLRICTQDNFLSDAYYETMQYVGDSRPHAFAWNTLTGSSEHLRNALQQFHYSRLPDGNITSCYPLKSTFVHPSYSLMWIDMIHDYMMYYGEKDLVREWISGIDATLDFFERIKNKNGIPGGSRWDYFVDWYSREGGGGIAPVSKNGNSALITLHLVYSLRNAADIIEWMGDNDKAQVYRERADKYIILVNELFYHKDKGMYSEDPEATFWDQRANIMAVLTDAVPKDEQKKLLDRVLGNEKLSRAGLYYRFNFFDALAHADAGEYFDRVLAPWWDVVNLGLSTTPERPVDENPRSEAHPWSASPVWAYYHVLCGIRPVAPGFEKGIIAPSPGNLEYIKANYPHPEGMISIDIEFKKPGPKGTITIPEGADFCFEWNGQSQKLTAGLNKIHIK